MLATRDFDSDCAGDLGGQKGATPPDVSHKIYIFLALIFTIFLTWVSFLELQLFLVWKPALGTKA